MMALTGNISSASWPYDFSQQNPLPSKSSIGLLHHNNLKHLDLFLFCNIWVVSLLNIINYDSFFIH